MAPRDAEFKHTPVKVIALLLRGAELNHTVSQEYALHNALMFSSVEIADIRKCRFGSTVSC